MCVCVRGGLEAHLWFLTSDGVKVNHSTGIKGRGVRGFR